MSGSLELNNTNYQERAIRASIVDGYVSQKALHVPEGAAIDVEADPAAIFTRTREQLRAIYAEPAGKLALSRVLEQQRQLHPDGEVTATFIRTDKAKVMNERICAALWPEDDSVFDAVSALAKPLAPRAGSDRVRLNTLPILTTLKHTWARLAALENMHVESGSALTLPDYVHETWESGLLPVKIIAPPKSEVKPEGIVEVTPEGKVEPKPKSGVPSTKSKSTKETVTEPKPDRIRETALAEPSPAAKTILETAPDPEPTLEAAQTSTACRLPEFMWGEDMLAMLVNLSPKAGRVMQVFMDSRPRPGAIFDDAANTLGLTRFEMAMQIKDVLVLARDYLTTNQYVQLQGMVRGRLPRTGLKW